MSHKDWFVARVVGCLLILGGVVGTLSLALPHPDFSDDRALAAVDVAAFAAGALLLAGARRAPRWLTFGALAGASTLVSLGVCFSGVAAGVYTSIFVWIVLVSAYFFPPRTAALQLAWLLGCYAVVLAWVPDSAGFSDLTRFLLTAIALAVAGGVTSWLIARKRAVQERADRFFNLTRDMLCTASPSGYFVELNPAWTEALGYTEDELRARPFIDFVHPEDRERTAAEAAELFAGADTVFFQNRYRAKDGTWRWLDWSSSCDSEQGLVYARATDVTEHKRLEAEREALVETLRSQARRDSLTNLPNRRWFAEEIMREVSRASRQRFPLCVAMVDLDHFKHYNDRCGHPTGDRLLRNCADRWTGTLRATDFMARYGGEEFVVLLPDCTLADAHVVIERLRAATPGGQTCSAGIAALETGESPEHLIARADAALYAAKSGGRDRTVVAGERVPVPTP
jgi:diguanylate cyclase (GGDEF)-like protein/PAS domain S-box-containing protein